jgi:protein TonB
MISATYPQPHHSRIGELALWSAAAVLIVCVHVGFAYYLMLQPEPVDDGGTPPAAIMIELAAEPEAAVTEENVMSQELEEAPQVNSNATEPVEEVVPEEQPQPEPVVEETPPPPPEEVVPEPVEEVVETLPEEIPEPVEEIDPIQQEMMAALENVEVPLPVVRPPPPAEVKPVEKKVVEEKKKVQQKPKKVAPASNLTEAAKVEAKQSERTAAQRNSAGSFSSSMTPAKWGSRVRTHIQRRKPRSLKADGVVATVQFNVAESGAISGVNLLRSTGSAEIDQEIVAWVRSSSPVPVPPPDAKRTVTLPISIR